MSELVDGQELAAGTEISVLQVEGGTVTLFDPAGQEFMATAARWSHFPPFALPDVMVVTITPGATASYL